MGLDSFSVVLRFLPDRRSISGCILDYTTIEGPTNLRIVQEGANLNFSVRVSGQMTKQLRLPMGNRGDIQLLHLVIDGERVTIQDAGQRTVSEDFHEPIGPAWDPEAILVFGSTASGKLRWGGTLASLEVYPGVGQPADTAAALLSYQFTRHDGSVVTDNGVEPGVDLLVPAQLIAPARKILSSPLTYWDGKWNKPDVVYNLIAFVPMGFLLGLYFKNRLRTPALLLITTGVACLISLSVELAQFYVPYRDSSIIDLTANTLAAFFGAWLSTSMTSVPLLARFFPRVQSEGYGTQAPDVPSEMKQTTSRP